MLVSVTLDIRKSLVVALFLCVFPNVYAAPDKDTGLSSETNNRILLEIPYMDREDLLGVMRLNLESLGKMVNAMANDDFRSVQEIAEQMSFNKKKGKGLSRRGNPVFAAMGVRFHAIDTIEVMKAAETKDRKATLYAMSKMIDTCVSCHSTFSVIEWPDNKIYKRPKPIKLVLPKEYTDTHQPAIH
ncbi:hypothetical protein [Thiolapillus sp.]|nr:hypothetical protein [Thiolapillus sp.]